MFNYEFQKQLVVLVGSTLIYVIAVYTILDFVHMVIKEIYQYGKNVIAKIKEKGCLK